MNVQKIEGNTEEAGLEETFSRLCTGTIVIEICLRSIRSQNLHVFKQT